MVGFEGKRSGAGANGVRSHSSSHAFSSACTSRLRDPHSQPAASSINPSMRLCLHFVSIYMYVLMYIGVQILKRIALGFHAY